MHIEEAFQAAIILLQALVKKIQLSSVFQVYIKTYFTLIKLLITYIFVVFTLYRP